MTKTEAGRLGGKATARKYGKEHMAEIGRKGAETTWTRYTLQPIGVNQFAMVNKETNQIVAFI